MSDKYTWSVDGMYEDEDQIALEIKLIEDQIKEIEDLKENPKENIVRILKLYEVTYRKLVHFYSYTHMKNDEDSNVAEYQKLNMQAQSLFAEFAAATAFINPLILSLSEEEVEDLLENEELENFTITIKKILRFKPYTLSGKEERILSSLMPNIEAPSEIYYYLTNADMEFPKLENSDEELRNDNFVLLQTDENRELRKEVFEKYYNTYNSFANTIAKTFYSNLNAKAIIAKLKGYDSVRQMELYEDDVDEKVYDALLDSIHANFDYIHKYYEIKKRALGLDEQHMYDVYMPITDKFDKEYTFEEAKELVIASVAPLGKQYQEDYKKAFEENWIDVYPRKGKRSGAYSSGSYDSHPFVLMNFNGSLDSVFTLAHEMGHSMHSYYSKKNNSFLNSNYTIFVAEVASTFNEALLLDYMMKRVESDEEKLYLVDFYLNSFKSTVFRQTMFAEFEKIVHERVENGEGLTAEDFNQIYLDLNKAYFGDHMVSDPEIAYEWMRIPHFYTDFYVYKYATGYAASQILARKVLDGEENAVENYLNFLKDGGKHFPIDQLKMAGVDMSNPNTVNEALGTFRNLVDELDKLID